MIYSNGGHFGFNYTHTSLANTGNCLYASVYIHVGVYLFSLGNKNAYFFNLYNPSINEKALVYVSILNQNISELGAFYKFKYLRVSI